MALNRQQTKQRLYFNHVPRTKSLKDDSVVMKGTTQARALKFSGPDVHSGKGTLVIDEQILREASYGGLPQGRPPASPLMKH
jgi:hypothetical protein